MADPKLFDGETSAKFRVVKTNKRGKAQNRILELNFQDGVITNKNTRGKVQKTHHASKVMFAEKVQQTMLVLHFPDKKDYKLNFVAPEDREMFCAKLVDLCKDCKINQVEPLQEVMFDPTKHSHFGEDSGAEPASDGSFTFRVKMTSGKELHLQDIVLFISLDGIAICDPASSAAGAAAPGAVLNAGSASQTAQAHKVRTFYPFAQVRSWENHGEFVILEVSKKGEAKKPPLQVKLKADEATCNAILKAIHTCITKLMEKKKAEQAKKKADKAAGIKPEKKKKEEPKKKAVTQEERFRRASLVVDVAAMANFQDAKAPAIPEGDAGGPTFAARRQSVLAATNRRASLIAGAGNVMDAMGGGTGMPADLMAAAVAAIDMEDTFEDANVAGGKVMGDVVGVLADAAGGGGDQSAGADANARRRMSLMSDVTGSATPQTGSERERRASLLLDLAAFVEEGEDDFNALGGIAEGEEEEEEEDEYDDFGGGGGGGGDDLDDVDILGVASGETSTI